MDAINLTFEDFRRIIGQQEIEKYLTAQERDTALKLVEELDNKLLKLNEEFEQYKLNSVAIPKTNG